MAATSEEERRGCPQNVQGPMPSFTHITLPQFRQLGAAARRGWRVARQVQRRDEGSAEREGFVWSSRVRMAESRSWRVVDAPCIELPPATLILVLGAGEEVLDDVREPVRTFGRSEIRCPDAEGGGLAAVVDAAGATFGNWRASGWSESAKVFARAGSGRARLLPPM